MSIPLMCSSYCLLSLANLEGEAEREARRADNARETASLLNGLIRDIYVLISRTKLKPGDLIAGADERREKSEAVEEKIERLRQLLAGREGERAVLDSVSGKLKEARKLIDTVEASVISGDKSELLLARSELLRLAPQLISPDLIALGEKLTAKARVEPHEERELRAQIRGQLWISFVFSLLVSIILSVLVTRSVTRRLAKLAHNSEVLAGGGEAVWSTGGNDEIQLLEENLADMAENIRDNLLKERVLIDNSRDIICLVDADLKIRRISQSVLQKLGVPADDLIGRSGLELINARKFPQEANLVRTAFNERRNCQFEIEAAVGEFKGGGSQSALAGNLGRATYAISMSALPQGQGAFIFHDISRIRSAERFKQEVLSMVSHDLRTPLATVGNTVELLGEGLFGRIDENGVRLLDDARAARDYMSNLIADLLFLDKAGSGNLVLHNEEVNCGELILSAVQAARDISSHFEFDVSDELADCALSIDCDRERFGIYLKRLIVSSSQAAPEPVVVRLRSLDAAATTTAPRRTIAIEILDLGKEIPAHLRQALFDPYKHAEFALYRPGSGMTLPVVATFISLQGGKISYFRDGQYNVYSLTMSATVS